jgi:hypothetical protein
MQKYKKNINNFYLIIIKIIRKIILNIKKYKSIKSVSRGRWGNSGHGTLMDRAFSCQAN